MVRQWNVPAKRKGLTPQQRTKVFCRTDGCCADCGLKIDATRDPFFCAHDHEGNRAVWQGNGDAFNLDDYRPLCETCWKGDTAEEAGDRGKERRVRTKHVTGRSKAPNGRGFQNSRSGPYKTCLTADGPKTVRR